MPSTAGAWASKNKKTLLIGAGGVALLALYERSRASSGSAGLLGGLTGGSTTATPTPTVGYDSSQLDQYNQLASAISSLNDQVGALQANTSAGAVASLPTAGGTGLPSPVASHPGIPANEFVIPGGFNQAVSLRTIATDLLPANERSNPTIVETQLQRLVAANPGLAGQTTAWGGHLLVTPSTTYTHG